MKMVQVWVNRHTGQVVRPNVIVNVGNPENWDFVGVEYIKP